MSSFLLHAVTSLTALEVHRQKEEELRKNDAYWQTRLAKQEQDLQKTASTLEKEYNETVHCQTHSLKSWKCLKSISQLIS